MFRTSLASGIAAPIHFDARTERLFHEHRKLAGAAKDFAYAHPRVVHLGDDPVVDHLIASAGFSSTDLFSLRLHVQGRPLTAICVPTRLWRTDESKERLLELKRDAASIGTDVLLVPQRWLRAQTRSAIARVIARSRRVRLGREHVAKVLEHVHSQPVTSIGEAAASIPEHEDATSVVLALCAQGFILLDRSAPLRMDTTLSSARSSGRAR